MKGKRGIIFSTRAQPILTLTPTFYLSLSTATQIDSLRVNYLPANKKSTAHRKMCNCLNKHKKNDLQVGDKEELLVVQVTVWASACGLDYVQLFPDFFKRVYSEVQVFSRQGSVHYCSDSCFVSRHHRKHDR